MKARYLFVTAVAVCLAFVGSLATTLAAKEVPRMTKEQLKEMLDSPNVVIIDVRIGKDWNTSDLKIKGAIREDAEKVKEWASKLDENKTYVLYCA